MIHEDIRACPFCGESEDVKACYQNRVYEDTWYVKCATCLTTGPRCCCKLNAIRLWNRRRMPHEPEMDIAPEMQEAPDVH